MELMGALILVPMISTVLTAFKGTLNIDSAFCWLDAQIALWWIRSVNKEFKQFVQNRVVEIRRLVSQHSGITAPQGPIQLKSVLVVPWLLNLLLIRCGGMVLIFF